MAIITKDSRTQRTLDFYGKNLYMGFGRTTAWDDEAYPDPPDELQSTIEELIFISKINTKQFVISGGSEITFKDTNWTSVLQANIFTQNVINLYLTVLIDYDNYPIVGYRQIGILENPIEVGGEICDQDIYTAAQIQNQGILHYLDNRLLTNRNPAQKENVSIILEF